MRHLLIAASMKDATQHDMLGCAAVLTPRSPHGARGINLPVHELRITVAMIGHPSLPLLLELAYPAFATMPREAS